MKYFNVTISCSVTCDHCVPAIFKVIIFRFVYLYGFDYFVVFELLVLDSKNSEIAAENG